MDSVPMSDRQAGISNMRRIENRIRHNSNQFIIMLMTIAIVLIILWALGLVTGSTLGGFVHVLLVIAIIVVLVRLIQGRKIL